jgi:hypothetical protein
MQVPKDHVHITPASKKNIPEESTWQQFAVCKTTSQHIPGDKELLMVAKSTNDKRC